MTYVDMFIAPVPIANRDLYCQHSQRCAALFKEFGAINQVECWGDDIPEGQVTSFPLAVQTKEGEAVVAGWVLWPSKEARDAGWEKIMQDPRMQSEEMPFDGKRLIHGGFETLFET